METMGQQGYGLLMERSGVGCVGTILRTWQQLIWMVRVQMSLREILALQDYGGGNRQNAINASLHLTKQDLFSKR